MNQKRQQAGTPGGVGGQFAEQHRPDGDTALGQGAEFHPGAEVVGKRADGERPVVGVVEGDLGFEYGEMTAYVRVNDPGSDRHDHIQIVPIRNLALSGDSVRLFDRDLSSLHKGLDHGVAVTISSDADSSSAGLPATVETPPYGEPGDMWAVVRIDQPGHEDHGVLRSVPADDISPRAAEPTNDAPAFVDVGSTDGDPVLAGFNDDGTVDIETGDGAIRISDDDIERLYAASLNAKRARHRASLVLDAPVAIVRNGLGDEYGTVVGHRPDGDFVDVRRADGRLISYPSASLRLAE
ncbi:hypothetical protein [Curtobacterium sp. MCSS17_016]|uniref:hypothetical protein n=1 Tax=Curtobacterium sp. MCSS17_016 TaxID=2175644 RepID=UPI000DAA9E21|nr:hypothetical protein [Curtobacterium sp. MCSS17_016]WIE81223.1 hypothetical protein DEJ19_018490 [Curtobacterium sp. MCSS17_016]